MSETLNNLSTLRGAESLTPQDAAPEAELYLGFGEVGQPDAQLIARLGELRTLGEFPHGEARTREIGREVAYLSFELQQRAIERPQA